MSLYITLTVVLGLAVVVWGMLSAFKIGYSAGKGEDIGDQFKDFDNVELIDPDVQDEKAEPIDKLMEEDEDGEEGN